MSRPACTAQGADAGVLLPTARGRDVARYAGRALGARWPALAAATLAMGAQAAAGLGVPGAIGWITQLVVDRATPAALAVPLALMAGCAVVGALATWVAGRLLARAVLPTLGALREGVVDAAVRLPLDTVERGGSGDIVSRVSVDVEEVADVAQGALGSLLSAVIAIVVTFAGLAGLDWRFALAALLAVPVQAWTLRWYLRASGPLYAAGRVAAGRRSGTLLEAFSTLPTIRAFRLDERQRARAADASEDAVAYETASSRIMTRFYGRLNLAELIGLAAILIVAFVLVGAGATSVGAATAAALFFAGLFDPINTVLGVMDEMMRAGASLARLVGVVHAAPAEQHGQPPERPGPLTGRALRFRYPGTADRSPALDGHEVDALALDGTPVGALALDGVDIDVAPGARVAIVGASGSGKTTLASVLAGVRHPLSGSVRYDGVAIDAMAPADRARHVAMIAQETHVFVGTIADNLRLARPDATDADVRAALVAVGADGWVDALPDGVATRVGTGGHALPALHAQHLAFARVRLLDPALVILDEATAEAGSDAARTLDTAADALVHGRAAFVVAHRLSQAASADLVLVMAAGRVIERGRHDDLIAAGSAYAELWRAWSGTSSR